MFICKDNVQNIVIINNILRCFELSLEFGYLVKVCGYVELQNYEVTFHVFGCNYRRKP